MQLNTKARATKAKARESVAPAAILPAPPAEIILPESVTATTEAKPAKPSAADKRAEYISDYATAKAVYAILNPGSASCPVKPAILFKAKPLNPKAYTLSPRGAASIYLAVLCSGKPLADGTTYPRRYIMQSREYIAENGCLSDFDGTAYTVDTTPGIGFETFTLRPGATAAIESLLGQAKLAAVRDMLATTASA